MEPIHIVDREVKVLKKNSLGIVKVQWTCYGPEDATWEHEENMWEEYPQIVYRFEENRMQDSVLSS